MFEDQDFQSLVEAGHSTGEVVTVNRFLITVKGLSDAPIGGMVMFENGYRGLIREATEDEVLIFNISSEELGIGTLVVLASEELTVGVGEGLIGRIVNALGEPLDDLGPIALSGQGPVFVQAPGIIERKAVEDQLATGVAVVDSMFPISRGQRMAVLGDAKSGKSTFLQQLTLNQYQMGTNIIVVHVLVAKRKVDIDTLVAKLRSTGAIKNAIVVVASVFDSLVQSYLAPYAGCAMGEALWQSGRDVIMVYDDLSNHAKVYREMSLLSRMSPGRDSYPGDIFYSASSLLERAGRLHSNGAAMAALPVVVTPGDDITAYLPTNIISITDGQIIFDLETFRSGVRPAVNVGLSVSRVGPKSRSNREKNAGVTISKKLADYRQAAEFSHFGSELASQAQADLELGRRLYEVFKQGPEEVYNLREQQLMLETTLKTEGKITLNVDALKRAVRELAPSITTEEQVDAAIEQLLKSSTVQQAAPTPAVATDAAATPPTDAKPVDKATEKSDDKSKDKDASKQPAPAEETKK